MLSLNSCDALLYSGVSYSLSDYVSYGLVKRGSDDVLCGQLVVWDQACDGVGSTLLHQLGDLFRDETFKEKVGFMSVRQLSRIAKERGAGSLGYAEAMLVAYNRKCRYTLRMTKLHSGAITAEDDFIEENEDPLADAPVFEK